MCAQSQRRTLGQGAPRPYTRPGPVHARRAPQGQRAHPRQQVTGRACLELKILDRWTRHSVLIDPRSLLSSTSAGITARSSTAARPHGLCAAQGRRHPRRPARPANCAEPVRDASRRGRVAEQPPPGAGRPCTREGCPVVTDPAGAGVRSRASSGHGEKIGWDGAVGMGLRWVAGVVTQGWAPWRFPSRYR